MPVDETKLYARTFQGPFYVAAGQQLNRAALRDQQGLLLTLRKYTQVALESAIEPALSHVAQKLRTSKAIALHLKQYVRHEEETPDPCEERIVPPTVTLALGHGSNAEIALLAAAMGAAAGLHTYFGAEALQAVGPDVAPVKPWIGTAFALIVDAPSSSHEPAQSAEIVRPHTWSHPTLDFVCTAQVAVSMEILTDAAFAYQLRDFIDPTDRGIVEHRPRPERPTPRK